MTGPRSQKQERQQVVRSLRAQGKTRVEIADVFRKRYRVNARTALRWAHGWSQSQAAEEWNRRWPDDPKTNKNISSWELWPASTGHAPSLDVLSRLAELYQCGLGDLLADQADYRHNDSAHRALSVRQEGWDTMERRNFMLGAGGMAALGLAAPALAMETARHALTQAVADDDPEITVDEWREIVSEYGYSYMTTAPSELAESLLVDVLGVQRAITRHRNGHDGVLRELNRAAALLSLLMAMTVSNLGQVRHAQRWWRSARQLADHSRDPETVVWVRGVEVVRALHEQRPVDAIFGLADEAETRLAGAPPRALPDLLSGKAQALAVAGRRDEAVAALRELQDVCGAQPAEARADRESIFVWAEHQLCYTESFVYSHLGDLRGAAAAQDRALAAYPAASRRGPAQIELQRALCLIRSRDVSEGVRHAQATLAGLPPADFIRPIFNLGSRVVAAIPQGRRTDASVVELRDRLALSATASRA